METDDESKLHFERLKRPKFYLVSVISSPSKRRRNLDDRKPLLTHLKDKDPLVDDPKSEHDDSEVITDVLAPNADGNSTPLSFSYLYTPEMKFDCSERIEVIPPALSMSLDEIGTEPATWNSNCQRRKCSDTDWGRNPLDDHPHLRAEGDNPNGNSLVGVKNEDLNEKRVPMKSENDDDCYELEFFPSVETSFEEPKSRELDRAEFYHLLQTNNPKAIRELYYLTHSPNNQARILDLISLAGESLYLNKLKNLKSIMGILVYLQDENIAFKIAKQLVKQLLIPQNVDVFTDLYNVYGLKWCRDLVSTLPVPPKEKSILKVLIDFAYNLHEVNDKCEIVNDILHQQFHIAVKTHKVFHRLSEYDNNTDDIANLIYVLKVFVLTNKNPLTPEVEEILTPAKCRDIAKAFLMCIMDAEDANCSAMSPFLKLLIDNLKEMAHKYAKQLRDKTNWSLDYSLYPCSRESRCKLCSFCVEFGASNSREHMMNCFFRQIKPLFTFTRCKVRDACKFQAVEIEKTPLVFKEITKTRHDIGSLIQFLKSQLRKMKTKK